MTYLIKKFWEYNWLKLLIWCAPFVVFLVRAYAMTRGAIFSDGLFKYWVLFVVLVGIITIIKRGVTQLKTINVLINDTDSPKSIIPLFDNGFTLAFFDKYTLYKYTSVCIKGTISGFPVTVSFTPETRSKWAYLDFSFAPLAKDVSKNDSDGTISEFPAKISIITEAISKLSRLDFSFASLSKGASKNNLEESIWFNMIGSAWYTKTPELKKDVKPDVLRFVEVLKEQGYTPVIQQQ